MPDDQLKFGDDAQSLALRKAWDSTLHILAGKINRVTFESYIRPIRPISFQDNQVILGVASSFAREWLHKYLALIQSNLSSVLGCTVDIAFKLISAEEQPIFGDSPRTADDTEKPPSRARIRKERPIPDEDLPWLPFNEKSNFDTFIVGRSNRLAQAGAMAVARQPGAVYNPLFIYGGSGLGKTHLLHAIGQSAKLENAEIRVALIDGENFTQHYVTSLRERKTEIFRRAYRSIDIWLVDDIQFIAGREQTKEEFFHTFNALYQMGKQIVISSDRSPRELRTMDERLRSRFECGLIADINSPELETREAILQRRCVVEGWEIPMELISYIAGAIQSNIRALEGALTKLVAYSSIMKQPYSVDLAQEVLGEYFIERPNPAMAKTVPVETIFKAVSEQCVISVEAILSQKRSKEIALARQIVMYLCRELTGLSLVQIGHCVGGRDHTTVQRGVAKIEGLLPNDQNLRRIVELIRSHLDR